MRFDTLYEYNYFMTRVKGSIKDKAYFNKLKSYANKTIPDDDYYLLSDTFDSYIGELKHHSRKKTFYKSLLKDELDVSAMPALYSLMTHLALGLTQRMDVRNDVDTTEFMNLKETVNRMVGVLVQGKKVKNTLYDALQ